MLLSVQKGGLHKKNQYKKRKKAYVCVLTAFIVGRRKMRPWPGIGLCGTENENWKSRSMSLWHSKEFMLYRVKAEEGL